MNDYSRLKIAIIGLGNIAQKAYLPIIANHIKIDPILFTRNSQVLKRLSSKYRIKKTYSNFEELVNSKPDAAMVHTSTESHAAIVLKLIKAGIPVFVDKPLSYTIEECEEVLNFASQKRINIYLGFNRRFAPLIRALKKEENPVQINWQKNRINQPGDPRVFVFDDFIHVVDSLRFLANGPVENLIIDGRIKEDELENVNVWWQQNDTFLIGGMNRISGLAEENVEFYTPGNKWIIKDLNSGIHFQNGMTSNLEFGNWEATLKKRGFVDMIEDWLSMVEDDKFNSGNIEDIWETHNLCETIVKKVLLINR